MYQSTDNAKPIILSREPKNENDTLNILWKLEALNALPFKKFQTLGHAGSGPDLIVHFQEDEQSHPDRYTSIEVENKFYNCLPSFPRRRESRRYKIPRTFAFAGATERQRSSESIAAAGIFLYHFNPHFLHIRI